MDSQNRMKNDEDRLHTIAQRRARTTATRGTGVFSVEQNNRSHYNYSWRLSNVDAITWGDIMSAVDGICLHQIVGELEKIKKSIDLDIAEARLLEQKAVWSVLRVHRKEISELIENINNA